MDMDGGSQLRRRMVGYSDYGDEPESADGMDYDIYDDADSTVAYAVQLAMKHKEDWLVDKALERIRRAQVMGQKNVRLSKPELEALERKRMHADGGSLERKSPASKASENGRLKAGDGSPTGGVARTGTRRSVSSAGQGRQMAPYNIADGSDGYDTWARASGSPSSQRTQSSRSPQSNTSPTQSPHKADRHSTIPYFRSQASSPLKSTAFQRPLPDDPHWVPTYQLPYPRDPPPYSLRSPVDPRGTSSRLGAAQYMSNYGERHPGSGRGSFASWLTAAGSANEDPLDEQDDEDDKESSSDGSSDELQMVDVVERKIPASPSARVATGKGNRRRRRRP
ncbi:hypothetical protein EYZ11_002316 [Aspergillus tanneri]|nr:hypothetical protein EYZ11_002316 [Aspergillus tanneri]